eukprot:2308204-Rhodomonas_salina.3
MQGVWKDRAGAGRCWRGLQTEHTLNVAVEDVAFLVEHHVIACSVQLLKAELSCILIEDLHDRIL